MTSSSPAQLHAFISGKVQGVSYRAWACEQAQRLQLTGWVKNLGDFRVELLAEGDLPALEELLRACEQGPPAAIVEEIEAKWGPYSGQWKEFEIWR